MQSIKVYNFKKYILFCIGIILLASCAQVVTLGGGKKDTTPPQALRYTPDSASLNFKSKTIEIVFDEFIQLKDLNNQLIISPPLQYTPDINIKGKSLIIEFNGKEVLKDYTTYCISLGNAIQDINENNPNENFSYIFSTGSYIDSLKLNGKVELAFDHKTEKGILVMLYSDLKDSAVYKSLPAYFAKTKDDGSFQINNIRAGKYKIRALKDVNANYKYDSELESIAFIDTLIDITTKQNVHIEMFQELPKKLFLKKYQYNSFGKVTFIFNKPGDSITLKPINYTFINGDVFYAPSVNKDTLVYWFKNISKDSLFLEVSNGNKVLDTVEFKLIKKEDAVKNNRNPLNFTLLNSPKGNQNFDLNSEINLIFNNLIDTIKTVEKIDFKQDSLPYKKTDMLGYERLKIQNILKLVYSGSSPKLNPNTNYHLFIPSGIFTDIFGLKNDTLKIDFKTREEKFYGNCKLKLIIPEGIDNKAATKPNYILQLLDEKENKIRESVCSNNETIYYEYLYPQKYKLKIVIDENVNGKWDTGNLSIKQYPEKVIYYPELIQVRSNWDLDLEWKISY